MMLTPVFTRQFEKDIKLMKKRRKKLEKLKAIIKILVEEKELSPLNRDHKLVGNWVGRRECHIKPDWLLIYKVEADKIIFERTGSHSDLF